jgi:hypothetical protein
MALEAEDIQRKELTWRSYSTGSKPEREPGHETPENTLVFFLIKKEKKISFLVVVCVHEWPLPSNPRNLPPRRGVRERIIVRG